VSSGLIVVRVIGEEVQAGRGLGYGGQKLDAKARVGFPGLDLDPHLIG
jgi:hypothetical protein